MRKARILAARHQNLADGFKPDIDTVRAEPLILVVAYTRELCCQIFDECHSLHSRSMLHPRVAYGGGPIREQREELAKGCNILIATPRRMNLNRKGIWVTRGCSSESVQDILHYE